MNLRTNGYPFADRVDAGRALAALLDGYAEPDDVLVLGLPRGGVPVAAEVARLLAAPLDILVVRKLGVPDYPELAMGAIAAVGDVVEVVRNDIVLDRLRISPADFEAVRGRELRELSRRTAAYRGGRAPIAVQGRVVIIVDDGLATGSTMRAAVAAVRTQRPQRLIVAVPVGFADTCAAQRREVDEVVCVRMPEPFVAVHQGYRDFTQTSDEQVLAILAERQNTVRPAHSAAVPSNRQPGTVSNPSTVNRPSEG